MDTTSNHLVKDLDSPDASCERRPPSQMRGSGWPLKRKHKETIDALAVRRRLRGKATVRCLQVQEEGELEKSYKEKIQRKFETMLDDDPELVLREMEVLRTLKSMVQEEDQEEEELLQTKIIPAQEAKRNWEEWRPSIDDEVNSLLKEKEALGQLSSEEYEKLIQEAKESGKQIQFIPSKVVFTRKPSPLSTTGKRKTRWVVCGNFEERREGEQNYSGGADAAALRIAIAAAAQFQWEGSSTDVRTAFLNADMDFQEGDTIILIKAPSVFVEKGYMKPHVYFIPLKRIPPITSTVG